MMSDAGDWTDIIKAIFEPHEYVHRSCPICTLPMTRDGDTYTCPKGHKFTKGKSKPDHLIEETSGDFHGDI